MSLSDFSIVSKIGDGLNTIVYKVLRSQDNNIYALKQVKLESMNSKQIENAINEVRILASIRHPNIIGYREAFYDKESKSLCIVMEYADGGDLLQKINVHRNKGQYFEELYIWDIFGQVVNGLSKLHELGILHRDLKVASSVTKTANVYLTRNGIAKLGDMNLSKVVRQSGMCQTQAGTPFYASPEVWRNEAYDYKSDMWSLGCILYEFINLKLPFRAKDMEGLYRKVSRGYYSRVNKSYSDDFMEVLKLLIQSDPKQRLSCRELLAQKVVQNNLKRKRSAELGQKSMLLKTIKFSKNINYLADRLPKPNYAPVKYKCHTYNSKNKSLIFDDRKIDKELPSLPKLKKRYSINDIHQNERKYLNQSLNNQRSQSKVSVRYRKPRAQF